MGFSVRYTAELEYSDDENITKEQARENLLELITRQPDFGSVEIVED